MQTFSGSNASQFNRERKKRRVMSEINITPMVDVMLVLLIIFMVTSPMLISGIEVNLPKTNSNALPSRQLPLVLSINKDGEIFLADTKIETNLLLEKLINITHERKDTDIFVKGDRELPYGTVVEIMTEIYNAGFTRVALVSDPKRQ